MAGGVTLPAAECAAPPLLRVGLWPVHPLAQEPLVRLGDQLPFDQPRQRAYHGPAPGRPRRTRPRHLHPQALDEIPGARAPVRRAPVGPARVCQQESRSVSIAHAGPGPQTVPDACTFADDAPRPVPTASATPSTQWSRPIRIDVCSMFARMPRYGPAQPGIRSATRMRATGQNGSSRHVLELFDSSSK
jgi:hypothetical protein